jgi:ribonuclease D
VTSAVPHPRRQVDAREADLPTPSEHGSVFVAQRNYEPIRPLLEPVDGVPPVVSMPGALADAASRLAAGSGPVAVDAERASGYRYSQRAYLVQLRRRGAGTVLVDPLPFTDIGLLQQAIGTAEWVLHAASQDLPCLAEIGLRPSRVFDTELAGRLLGYERVGLGMMVERVLGYSLEKGHSAADWSTRPLPEPWLRYAALDVELLVDLRDALEAELIAQDKLGFALEEFAALAAAPPREPRAEPWRRTSGIHRTRSRRQLAAVRAMWQARDRLARSRDIAQGRVLPDNAIIEAVLAAPADAAALTRLPVFSGPRARRNASLWVAALREAAALPEDELPLPGAAGGDGLPPPNRWAERDPAAVARPHPGQRSFVRSCRPILDTGGEPARAGTGPSSGVVASGGGDGRRGCGNAELGRRRSWQVKLAAPVLAEALADAGSETAVDSGTPAELGGAGAP